MAPDLSSIRTSPHQSPLQPNRTSPAGVRRPSQTGGTPFPQTLSSPHWGSSQSPPPMTSISTLPAANVVRGDNTGVGGGPGPVRHPQPLTASELHTELEKEQEGVVNRLTRELSHLRAQQSASVASIGSSTSTGLVDAQDPTTNLSHRNSGSSYAGPSHRRHHRSSSSTSSRGITPSRGSITETIPTGAAVQIPADRAQWGSSPSRQNSTASSRRSGASSPAFSSSARSSSLLPQGDPFTQTLPHRPSLSSRQQQQQQHHLLQAGQLQSPSPEIHQQTSPPSLGGSGLSPGRSEEAAHHRAELEALKRENDGLRRRVKELERLASARRGSTDGGRPSSSMSPPPA